MATASYWNVVNTDISDEAAAFQHELESGNAQYMLEVCATVSSDEKPSSLPVLAACYGSSLVCLAVDSHLMIFSNAGRNFLAKLDFVSCVDDIVCSEDGAIIIAGTSSGDVHVIDASTGQIIVSRPLEAMLSNNNKRFFTTIQFGTPQMLLLLTQSCSLHIVDGLDITNLAGLKHTVIETNDTIWTSMTSDGNLITAGPNSIRVWCPNNPGGTEHLHPIRVADGLPFTLSKFAVACHDNFLIVSNTAGDLTLWSVDLLVSLAKLPSPPVDHFVVLDSPVQSDGELTAKLTVLTHPNADGNREIRVCSVPGMQCLYSVELSSFAYLASPVKNVDSLFFVEGMADGHGTSAGFSCVRLASLSETNAETRLSRLLQKERFSDAEMLAKMFGLDVQHVYRAKISQLLDSLSPWKTATMDESTGASMTSQLISCLEEIKDTTVIMDCCLSATLPSLEGLKQLLSLGNRCLMDGSLPKNSIPSYKKQLAEIEHRLTTFLVAFGQDHYSGEQWEKFRNADLSVEFCKALSAGQIEIAAVLWNRHGDEMEHKLLSTAEQLQVLLFSISDNVMLPKLRCWLAEGLIPHLLNSDQSRAMIATLAHWIESRAMDLEVTDKSGWPKNAVELCQVLNCGVDGTVFKDLTPGEYAARVVGLTVPRLKLRDAAMARSSDPLVRLRILVHDLQRLSILQATYNFSMPLEEFRAESVRSVAFRMLDRVVAVELLASAVVKTVRPYASCHGLDCDDLLASYVEDLAGRCGLGGWHVTAAWESKAVEVLKLISSVTLRHRALKAVLTSARFPWEDDVAAAVHEAVAADPNDAGLREKCRLAKFKQQLINYDLRAFNVAEASRAMDLAFYIIKQDRETAVEDALEVVKFYSLEAAEVYLFRCQFLAEQKRSNELIRFMRQLPKEVNREVGDRFVRYACRLASLNMQHDRRHLYLVAACDILRLQLDDRSANEGDRVEIQNRLRTLGNIDALFSEFGIFISFDDFTCKSKRYEILEGYVKTTDRKASSIAGASLKSGVLAEGRKPSSFSLNDVSNLTNVYRLAELLNVGRDEIRYGCALRYAASGQLPETIDTLKNIRNSLSKMNNPARRVLHVIHTLCAMLSKANLEQFVGAVPQALIADLRELTSWAVAIVDVNLLADGAQLCRALRLASELLELCDAGDFGIGQQRNFDAYNEWTFDDFLPDDDGGLVMDAKLAQPVAFEYVVSTCPNFSSCPLPYVQSDTRKSGVVLEVAAKIDQLLKSNAQTRLLLEYILGTAGLLGGSIPLSELQTALTATLKRVISQQRADYRLGLACLCSLPIPVAYETLTKFASSAGIQYKKALSVAQLGLEYTTLMGDPVAQSVAQEKVAEAWWGYRLTKLRISFRDAFGRGREEKKQLIPTFARCPSISVADVVDYCTSLKLNEDTDAMALYLKCLLIPFANWEGGDRDTCQGNNSATVASILARAEEACSRMEPRILGTTLEYILDRLDPYDYERIGFVLEWLGRIVNEPSLCDETIVIQRSPSSVERDRKLLVYLRQYKRVSPPGEAEPCGAGATDRLPFHQLTADHWRIITPELSAETVDVWVPIAALLRVPADQVYTTAIRNIVQDHIRRRNGAVPAGTQNWNEAAADTKLFEVIDRLLSCIVATDLAVMCVGWIARELPPGAEKVLSCRSCVAVAQKWVSSCKPSDKQKAADALNKYTTMYRQISIEQILHVNGLAERDLLALVSSPARLIFRLYEHSSIVERIRSGQVHSSMPDIHAVVDQIAAVGLVDASKVRLTLLEKWLPSRHARLQQESADVTMNGDEAFNASVSTDGQDGDIGATDEEEIDLMRAIYILERRSQSADDAAVYLIRFALEGSEDVHTTPMCQVRALRCLLALVDLADVERLSERGGWRERLAAMLYDGELRRLRVIPSTESFDRVDKSALARAVCRSRDSGAARVAACLAVDFCRSDDQLWAGVLHRLTAGDVRIAIRSMPWRGQQIASAVASLVSSGLSGESLKRSVANDLISVVQRLPALVDSKTLRDWAAKFLALGMPACSVACCMMLAPSERGEHLKLIHDSQLGSVVTDIDDFERASGRIFMMGSRIREFVNAKRSANSLSSSPKSCSEKSVVGDSNMYRSAFLPVAGDAGDNI